jgi:tetratricopeptide (TPR) repeat protein
MKTRSCLLFFFIIFTTTNLFANDERYLEAMRKNIDAMYKSKDIQQFQEVVNNLERIASVEKNKWEPLYYIAFGNIMMANFEKDNGKKDAYLDVATSYIEKAKALSPKESEIFAIEGFAMMLKVAIDPQSRGMVYSQKATQACAKAVELNPENPRAFALLAQMQFGAAQFFNSPTTEACDTNARALTLFDEYTPTQVLAPAWGKAMAESLKERCK